MSKQFVAILVIIVALLIGVFIATKDDASSPTNGNDGQPSSHTIGEGTSGVTLIEYGDFQCPACKSYIPIIEQIKQEYGDEITFQFRHYPLIQIHNHAYIASRAAEAAGLQGKFFPMHDLIYENQESWSQLNDPTETFRQYAEQLELDMDKFSEDMFGGQVAATINADIEEAKAIDATSTPTFVLNGEKLEGNPQSVEEFKQLIDNAINSSNQNQ